MNENNIADLILDAAFYIHKKLGPGLYENVYEVILMKLLSKKGCMYKGKSQSRLNLKVNILMRDSELIYLLKERSLLK